MRRYDIDSVRVIAFGLLILYHVGEFFTWDYHLNNSVLYEWLRYPMIFLNRWRMPLLFIISGMGTFFNVSKRNGVYFIKERLVRLLIPLVVGILLIIPPQVYFERLDAGQFTGNYLEFWPAMAYVGVYPTGNFSWHHLWFLPYLLLFSLILTPIFIYLLKHPQAWIICKTKSLSTGKFGLFILTIPLIFWFVFLKPRFPSNHALVGDWFNVINYCTLFFYGFLMMTIKDAFWKNAIKNRRLYLIIGIIAYTVFLCLDIIGNFPGWRVFSNTIQAINVWTWILAILGFAAKYLNKPSRELSYANEAVYPFYILHQTVLITLGYYLKNIEICFFVKFSIMLIGTFGISWLIYEFCIRRYNWVRPLFGMKRKN